MATRGGLKAKSAVLLIKSETTTGSDASPTLASNAVVGYEVSVAPLGEATTFHTKPVTAGDSFLGVGCPVPGLQGGSLSFKVPLVGSGSAGTAPDYGPALKACALSETNVSATSSTYKTIATETTATIYVYLGPAADFTSQPNWKLYKLLGAAGNAKITAGDGEPAMIEFEFKGAYVEPADISDPGDPTLLQVCPEPFLSASLTWTPNGGSAHSPRVRSLEIDLGNDVQPRKDMQQSSGILSYGVMDRTPVWSMQIEEELASGRNWWNDYTASTFGVLECGTIGSTAGNQYDLQANRAQLGEAPEMSEQDGWVVLDTSWHMTTDLSDLSTTAFQLQFT